jgi:hypothetical protein
MRAADKKIAFKMGHAAVICYKRFVFSKYQTPASDLDFVLQRFRSPPLQLFRNATEQILLHCWLNM